MMKRILSILLVTVMVLSLAACGSKATPAPGAGAAAGGELVIGCPQPLTGTNAQVGDATLKAVQLYAKLANERGGINGQQLRVVSYDDQGSPEEAVKIATKLIEVDKVNWIVSSLISSCNLAAGQSYNEAKIPTIGTGLSPTWMNQGWEYVFRSCANTGFAMPILAQKMKDIGISKIAMFEGQDDSAKAGGDDMRAACKELGIEVLTVESYVEGDSDFSGQVAKIINSKPDVVFNSTFSVTQPLFAKQLRQFGYDGLVFNKETLTADNINVSGDAANYWAFMFPYVTMDSIDKVDEPIMKDFYEKYIAEYGEVPFHDCAFRSWDAMLIFEEAARIAGTNDGEAIKEAINQVKDLPILGGTADFSQGDREALHEYRSYIILDGENTSLDEWIESGKFEEFKAKFN